MSLTHTQLATAAVTQAVEEAQYAIGRLDDLLTDDQLSPQMVKRVLKDLKLDLPHLTLEDMEFWLDNEDDDEPLLKTPFLKSIRVVRMLFGAATS